MSRVRRILRRITLGTVLLALLAALVFAGWMVATESGARFTVAYISGLVPNFKLRYAGGTMLGPLELSTVLVKTKKVRIEASDVAVDWSPGCLLVREACISDLRVKLLTLTFATPATAPPPADVKRNLPSLSLPLRLDVSHLAVDTFDVVRGDKVTRYTGVDAALDWDGDEMRVGRVVIGMPSWQAEGTGTLRTHGDWPLDALLSFQVPRNTRGTTAPVFTLRGSGTGTLLDAKLALQSGGIVTAGITGTLRTLQPGMPFTARATIPHFSIPPRGAPEKSAQLDDITLEAAGLLLGEFRIDGHARVDTPWTPPLPATATSRGTWRGLQTIELRIDDPRLRLRAESDYRWLGGQHFRGSIDLQHLDLSIVNANTPSRLSGTVGVSGDVDASGTVIRLDLSPLAGRFRQWPLVARGPLRWQQSRWHFDDLSLAMGDNVMRVDGTLGDAWDAQASLSLNDLRVIIPALAGAATGAARIDGAPLDPALHFAVTARDFRLPSVPLPAPASMPSLAARRVQLPAGDWHLAGTLTLREVMLDDAHTLRAPFGMAASGRVGWQDRLRWDFDTELRRLSLHDLLPELDGVVDGPFVTRGTLGASLESLELHAQLAGDEASRPLAIDTDLVWTPKRIEIANARLAHGPNRFALKGSLSAKESDLVLDIDAPRLGETLRETRGALRLAGTIKGPHESPAITLDTEGHDLAWLGWQLKSLRAAAQVVAGGEQDSSAAVELAGLSRAGRALDTFRFEMRGSRKRHTGSLTLEANRLAVEFAGEGGLNERWQENALWDGRLDSGVVRMGAADWHAVTAATLAYQAGSISLAPHCWTDAANTARACLVKPAQIGRSGHLDAEIFHLPVASLLGDALPVDTRVDGRIGGILTADWQDGILRHLFADVLNAEPVRISLASDDEHPVTATFDTLAVRARVGDEGASLEALADGRDSGRVSAGVRVDRAARRGSLPENLSGALTGIVDASGVRLDLLEAITYQVNEVGGTLGGNVALSGFVDDPQVTGHVSVRDGQLAFTRLPFRLVGITLDSDFDGEHATLKGSFRTPDSTLIGQPILEGGLIRTVPGGRADIDGWLQLDAGGWTGGGTLKGSELGIASLPNYHFTVAPDVTFSLAPDQIGIEGQVQVPDGMLDLKSLPARSIARSGDVVIVQAEQTVKKGGMGFRQDVDIDVVLGEAVRFRAFGGEGRLTGALRVRSTPALPLLVDGELHVHEGKYAALGQTLNIRQGDVIFNGPADQPLIDAVAVRPIDDPAIREIGLRLTGSLRDPQTTLWSVPAMSNEEALSWLTTGRPLSEGPLNLRGEAAQAALSLGIAQGSAILTAAGQEVGLQDVQLATRGEGEKSELQVGTNLNQRVFVGYNRRVFTGDESVLLRLHLTRKLMLEALSGIDSALDIFYTFEF